MEQSIKAKQEQEDEANPKTSAQSSLIRGVVEQSMLPSRSVLGLEGHHTTTSALAFGEVGDAPAPCVNSGNDGGIIIYSRARKGTVPPATAVDEEEKSHSEIDVGMKVRSETQKGGSTKKGGMKKETRGKVDVAVVVVKKEDDDYDGYEKNQVIEEEEEEKSGDGGERSSNRGRAFERPTHRAHNNDVERRKTALLTPKLLSLPLQARNPPATMAPESSDNQNKTIANGNINIDDDDDDDIIPFIGHGGVPTVAASVFSTPQTILAASAVASPTTASPQQNFPQKQQQHSGEPTINTNNSNNSNSVSDSSNNKSRTIVASGGGIITGTDGGAPAMLTKFVVSSTANIMILMQANNQNNNKGGDAGESAPPPAADAFLQAATNTSLNSGGAINKRGSFVPATATASDPLPPFSMAAVPLAPAGYAPVTPPRARQPPPPAVTIFTDNGSLALSSAPPPHAAPPTSSSTSIMQPLVSSVHNQTQTQRGDDNSSAAHMIGIMPVVSNGSAQSGGGGGGGGGMHTASTRKRHDESDHRASGLRGRFPEKPTTTNINNSDNGMINIVNNGSLQSITLTTYTINNMINNNNNYYHHHHYREEDNLPRGKDHYYYGDRAEQKGNGNSYGDRSAGELKREAEKEVPPPNRFDGRNPTEKTVGRGGLNNESGAYSPYTARMTGGNGVEGGGEGRVAGEGYLVVHSTLLTPAEIILDIQTSTPGHFLTVLLAHTPRISCSPTPSFRSVVSTAFLSIASSSHAFLIARSRYTRGPTPQGLATLQAVTAILDFMCKEIFGNVDLVARCIMSGREYSGWGGLRSTRRKNQKQRRGVEGDTSNEEVGKRVRNKPVGDNVKRKATPKNESREEKTLSSSSTTSSAETRERGGREWSANGATQNSAFFEPQDDVCARVDEGAVGDGSSAPPLSKKDQKGRRGEQNEGTKLLGSTGLGLGLRGGGAVGVKTIKGLGLGLGLLRGQRPTPEAEQATSLSPPLTLLSPSSPPSLTNRNPLLSPTSQQGTAAGVAGMGNINLGAKVFAGSPPTSQQGSPLHPLGVSKQIGSNRADVAPPKQQQEEKEKVNEDTNANTNSSSSSGLHFLSLVRQWVEMYTLEVRDNQLGEDAVTPMFQISLEITRTFRSKLQSQMAKELQMRRELEEKDGEGQYQQQKRESNREDQKSSSVASLHGEGGGLFERFYQSDEAFLQRRILPIAKYVRLPWSLLTSASTSPPLFHPTAGRGVGRADYDAHNNGKHDKDQIRKWAHQWAANKRKMTTWGEHHRMDDDGSHPMYFDKVNNRSVDSSSGGDASNTRNDNNGNDENDFFMVFDSDRLKRWGASHFHELALVSERRVAKGSQLQARPDQRLRQHERYGEGESEGSNTDDSAAFEANVHMSPPSFSTSSVSSFSSTRIKNNTKKSRKPKKEQQNSSSSSSAAGSCSSGRMIGICMLILSIASLGATAAMSLFLMNTLQKRIDDLALGVLTEWAAHESDAATTSTDSTTFSIATASSNPTTAGVTTPDSSLYALAAKSVGGEDFLPFPPLIILAPAIFGAVIIILLLVLSMVMAIGARDRSRSRRGLQTEKRRCGSKGEGEEKELQDGDGVRTWRSKKTRRRRGGDDARSGEGTQSSSSFYFSSEVDVASSHALGAYSSSGDEQGSSRHRPPVDKDGSVAVTIWGEKDACCGDSDNTHNNGKNKIKKGVRGGDASADSSVFRNFSSSSARSPTAANAAMYARESTPFSTDTLFLPPSEDALRHADAVFFPFFDVKHLRRIATLVRACECAGLLNASSVAFEDLVKIDLVDQRQAGREANLANKALPSAQYGAPVSASPLPFVLSTLLTSVAGGSGVLPTNNGPRNSNVVNLYRPASQPNPNNTHLTMSDPIYASGASPASSYNNYNQQQQQQQQHAQTQQLLLLNNDASAASSPRTEHFQSLRSAAAAPSAGQRGSAGGNEIPVANTAVHNHLIIMGADTNFKVSYWNAAAEAATGYTFEEVVGHPIGSLIGEKALDAMRRVANHPNTKATRLVSVNSVRVLGKREDQVFTMSATVTSSVLPPQTPSPSLFASAGGGGPPQPFTDKSAAIAKTAVAICGTIRENFRRSPQAYALKILHAQLRHELVMLAHVLRGEHPCANVAFLGGGKEGEWMSDSGRRRTRNIIVDNYFSGFGSSFGSSSAAREDGIDSRNTDHTIHNYYHHEHTDEHPEDNSKKGGLGLGLGSWRYPSLLLLPPDAAAGASAGEKFGTGGGGSRGGSQQTHTIDTKNTHDANRRLSVLPSVPSSAAIKPARGPLTPLTPGPTPGVLHVVGATSQQQPQQHQPKQKNKKEQKSSSPASQASSSSSSPHPRPYPFPPPPRGDVELSAPMVESQSSEYDYDDDEVGGEKTDGKTNEKLAQPHKAELFADEEQPQHPSVQLKGQPEEEDGDTTHRDVAHALGNTGTFMGDVIAGMLTSVVSYSDSKEHKHHHKKEQQQQQEESVVEGKRDSALVIDGIAKEEGGTAACSTQQLLVSSSSSSLIIVNKNDFTPSYDPPGGGDLLANAAPSSPTLHFPPPPSVPRLEGKKKTYQGARRGVSKENSGDMPSPRVFAVGGVKQRSSFSPSPPTSPPHQHQHVVPPTRIDVNFADGTTGSDVSPRDGSSDGGLPKLVNDCPRHHSPHEEQKMRQDPSQTTRKMMMKMMSTKLKVAESKISQCLQLAELGGTWDRVKEISSKMQEWEHNTTDTLFSNIVGKYSARMDLCYRNKAIVPDVFLVGSTYLDTALGTIFQATRTRLRCEVTYNPVIGASFSPGGTNGFDQNDYSDTDGFLEITIASLAGEDIGAAFGNCLGTSLLLQQFQRSSRRVRHQSFSTVEATTSSHSGASLQSSQNHNNNRLKGTPKTGSSNNVAPVATSSQQGKISSLLGGGGGGGGLAVHVIPGVATAGLIPLPSPTPILLGVDGIGGADELAGRSTSSFFAPHPLPSIRRRDTNVSLATTATSSDRPHHHHPHLSLGAQPSFASSTYYKHYYYPYPYAAGGSSTDVGSDVIALGGVGVVGHKQQQRRESLFDSAGGAADMMAMMLKKKEGGPLAYSNSNSSAVLQTLPGAVPSSYSLFSNNRRSPTANSTAAVRLQFFGSHSAAAAAAAYRRESVVGIGSPLLSGGAGGRKGFAVYFGDLNGYFNSERSHHLLLPSVAGVGVDSEGLSGKERLQRQQQQQQPPSPLDHDPNQSQSPPPPANLPNTASVTALHPVLVPITTTPMAAESAPITRTTTRTPPQSSAVPQKQQQQQQHNPLMIPTSTFGPPAHATPQQRARALSVEQTIAEIGGTVGLLDTHSLVTGQAFAFNVREGIAGRTVFIRVPIRLPRKRSSGGKRRDSRGTSLGSSVSLTTLGGAGSSVNSYVSAITNMSSALGAASSLNYYKNNDYCSLVVYEPNSFYRHSICDLLWARGHAVMIVETLEGLKKLLPFFPSSKSRRPPLLLSGGAAASSSGFPSTSFYSNSPPPVKVDCFVISVEDEVGISMAKLLLSGDDNTNGEGNDDDDNNNFNHVNTESSGSKRIKEPSLVASTTNGRVPLSAALPSLGGIFGISSSNVPTSTAATTAMGTTKPPLPSRTTGIRHSSYFSFAGQYTIALTAERRSTADRIAKVFDHRLVKTTSGAQQIHTIAKPFRKSHIRALTRDATARRVERQQKILREEKNKKLFQTYRNAPWARGALLGRGSHGEVFEAWNTLTKGKMAVKEIRTTIMDKRKEEEFANEIDVMCELQHPNIVQYFYCEKVDKSGGAGGKKEQSLGNEGKENKEVEGGGILLFMELCEGGHLRNYISKQPQKRLKMAEVVSFTRQLVDALAYLHSLNFAHRDIKPENVLLATSATEAGAQNNLNGDGLIVLPPASPHVVKLTDFGTAARVLSAGAKPFTETAGTMRYMAPEVFNGEPYGTACDVWSIGVLVLDMMGMPVPWLDGKDFFAINEFYTSTALFGEGGVGVGGLESGDERVSESRSGCTVPLPDSLRGEARRFVEACLVPNQAERALASTLLHHPFLLPEKLLLYASSDDDDDDDEKSEGEHREDDGEANSFKNSKNKKNKANNVEEEEQVEGAIHNKKSIEGKEGSKKKQQQQQQQPRRHHIIGGVRHYNPHFGGGVVDGADEVEEGLDKANRGPAEKRRGASSFSSSSSTSLSSSDDGNKDHSSSASNDEDDDSGSDACFMIQNGSSPFGMQLLIDHNNNNNNNGLGGNEKAHAHTHTNTSDDNHIVQRSKANNKNQMVNSGTFATNRITTTTTGMENLLLPLADAPPLFMPNTDTLMNIESDKTSSNNNNNNNGFFTSVVTNARGGGNRDGGETGTEGIKSRSVTTYNRPTTIGGGGGGGAGSTSAVPSSSYFRGNGIRTNADGNIVKAVSTVIINNSRGGGGDNRAKTMADDDFEANGSSVAPPPLAGGLNSLPLAGLTSATIINGSSSKTTSTIEIGVTTPRPSSAGIFRKKPTNNSNTFDSDSNTNANRIANQNTVIHDNNSSRRGVTTTTVCGKDMGRRNVVENTTAAQQVQPGSRTPSFPRGTSSTSPLGVPLPQAARPQHIHPVLGSYQQRHSNQGAGVNNDDDDSPRDGSSLKTCTLHSDESKPSSVIFADVRHSPMPHDLPNATVSTGSSSDRGGAGGRGGGRGSSSLPWLVSNHTADGSTFSGENDEAKTDKITNNNNCFQNVATTATAVNIELTSQQQQQRQQQKSGVPCNGVASLTEPKLMSEDGSHRTNTPKRGGDIVFGSPLSAKAAAGGEKEVRRHQQKPPQRDDTDSKKSIGSSNSNSTAAAGGIGDGGNSTVSISTNLNNPTTISPQLQHDTSGGTTSTRSPSASAAHLLSGLPRAPSALITKMLGVGKE